MWAVFGVSNYKRRVWTARMMLELHSHRQAVFVTLTYSPENLPEGNTLVKRDVQLFLKRLRKAYVLPVRYFAVGEYGDRTGRAHYHLVLYGIGRDAADLIQTAWGLGHIHVGDVTHDSCQYVAGYVTKKLTNPKDKRLMGREPEFSLMSRRPGIGAAAAEVIGTSLTRSSGGALWVAREGDVPKVARIDGRNMPLGRYMVGKVRLSVGMENETSPPEKLAQYTAQMQAVRDFVGPHAFKAGAYVDWEKVDKVIRRHERSRKLSPKVF